MSETTSPTANYTMGYSDEFRQLLNRRSAETHAFHLLPHLSPSMRVLDFGCGPDIITVGLDADTGLLPAFALEAFRDLEQDVRQSIARIQTNPLHSGERPNAWLHLRLFDRPPQRGVTELSMDGSCIMVRIALLAGTLLACVLVLACSSASINESLPSGVAPSTLEVGQQRFAANCAACHGDMGEGQPNWHIPKADGILPAPPLNGDGHAWHHGDGFLYRVVSQGGKIQEGPGVPNFKSGMPAFKSILSHDEILSVLAYVKSLWGDKMKLGFSIRESQALASENDPLPIAAE